MELHESPRLPREFRCAARNCGLKEREADLALFHSRPPAAAAAIFTRNHFPGAPVLLGRERIRGGRLRAVVVNSRISNVATGEQGLRDARRMARLAAEELGIPEEEVLVGSTGVIGRPLPMDRIEKGLRGMSGELGDDPWPAARAMMTTDRVPKALSLGVGDAVLTAVGKGAGMIAPNLATMLVYLFTDAEMEAQELDRLLRETAADTFNCLSVDTDTSTSDMVGILANGRAGPVDPSAFRTALETACLRMAEWVARDGEGATKLLRVAVEGAADQGEARAVARSVAESPLVKTMTYGADPNVGRILMAIGKCVDCRIEPGRVAAWLQGVPVVEGGGQALFDEARVRALLADDPVEIRVDLGVGEGRGRAFGCDLTEGYIHENIAYASS